MSELEKAQQKFNATAKEYWKFNSKRDQALAADETPSDFVQQEVNVNLRICLTLADIFTDLDTSAMESNPNK